MTDQPQLTGAELLDRVEAAGQRFIAFSSEHDRVAWVLFHAATHGQPARRCSVCSISNPLRGGPSS